jgi:hypothetical protein
MNPLEIRFSKPNRREQGSALLVTLMVLVGLSLLGLAFVATSESESSISANQRNYAQARVISEAGTKSIAQCFNYPKWCEDENLVPLNANGVDWKRERTLINPAYKGFFKTDTSIKLTDKPWRPALANRLLGDRDHPDILLNEDTNDTYIDNLNAKLLNTGDTKITEVRFYSPPVVGGTLNDLGFWEGGTKYGVATVEVTSEQLLDGESIARATTRATISEWPIPVPGGPYQSSGGMQFSGDQLMAWGKVTSLAAMQQYKIGAWDTSIPWHDAWERVHFEQGYDSSERFQPARAYAAGDIVRPTVGGVPAGIEYRVKTPGVSGAIQPTCCSNVSGLQWLNGPLTTVGALRTVNSGTVQFEERYPTGYPNDNGKLYDTSSYLHELTLKTFGDPWLEIRSRGTIQLQSNSGVPAPWNAADPIPYKYTTPRLDEAFYGKGGLSNIFQSQTANVKTDKKEVTFPKMSYKFWKQMAQAGSSVGTAGIYYLAYCTAGNAPYTGCVAGQWSDNKVSKPWFDWINIEGTGKAGYYFFDTAATVAAKSNQDPTAPAWGGTLVTPPPQGNGNFRMRGFIYFNANLPATNSAPNDYYPMPAEPYRDVGYRRVETNPASPDYRSFALDVSGTVIVEGANDNGWGYQDLAWSNNGGTPNGRFDVFVASSTFTKNADDATGASALLTTVTTFKPVPYYPGCIPGSGGTGIGGLAVNCSEPHEPYLNYIYATVPSSWQPFTPATMGTRVEWQAPGSQTRGPRVRASANTAEPCTQTGGLANPHQWTNLDYKNCTSNSYDSNGLMRMDAILDGVIYIQGSFNSDKKMFGSVLVNQNAGGGNNQTIWFDERMKTGQWPPAEWNLPRTFISSLQTEN